MLLFAVSDHPTTATVPAGTDAALLVTALVVGVVAAVAVVLQVSGDGYGLFAPPRSHPLDQFDPTAQRPADPIGAFDQRGRSQVGSGATRAASTSLTRIGSLRTGLSGRARQVLARTPRLLTGLVLYGVAIGLIVAARLGVDPWDVFGQGIALLVHLPFGLVTNLIGAVVLLLWWPLRQRPGVGTVANVLVVGTVAGVAVSVLPVELPILGRVALLLGGIVLLSIGTGIYVGADLGAGPRDGLMLGVHRRLGWPIWLARTLIEGTVLVAGWLLGGNVGIGTVVFAVSIGALCGITIPLFAPRGSPASEH